MKERFEVDPQVAKRLQNIGDLQRALGVEQRQVILEPLPHLAPTLGIEIEINWSQRFPGFADTWLTGEKPSEFSYEKKQRFNAECAKLDATMRDRYRLAEKHGIPKGRDGYWEFAHAPTKHPEILAAEVQTLYEGGLLPQGHEYSLHLTLGGIPFGKNAYMIALMLELQDGTTPQRITSEFNKRAWSRLGEAGIKNRRPEELDGDNEGFEIRTLSLRSAQQLAGVLANASWLGSLANCTGQWPHSNEAAEWVRLCNEVAMQLAEYGLSSESKWPEPRNEPELWGKYAQLLAATVEVKQ